jgi:hypothetical protein
MQMTAACSIPVKTTIKSKIYLIFQNSISPDSKTKIDETEQNRTEHAIRSLLFETHMT